MMTSCFNGAGVLPLEVFIHETLRRSKTSYSTLQVALYYIVLLKGKVSDRDFTKEQPRPDDNQQSTCRAMQCGRRMFLAALMLASKYLQDRNYSTRAWSKISGLRIPEINENETEYLKSIDYALHIKKEEFENWSKIVLSLSRLSKVRPGCRPNFASLRPHGSSSHYDPIASTSHGGHQPYSNQWWNDLLKDLEPQLVRNGKDTDAFLAEHLPFDNVAEFLAQHTGGLPTSTQGGSTQNIDMTLTEALAPRNTAVPVLPTPTELRAPSPGRVTTLPMRPCPPNLPTPQSTPRGVDALTTVPGSRKPPTSQVLRCSASYDVLRAMRKQCIVNANLERCPPPRPQSFALPPVRSLMRPAESNLACYSRSATPAVFSPASSISSESSNQTSRSRSSSISSNSSCPSWLPGINGPSVSRTETPVSTMSPLRRVTSLPEQPNHSVTEAVRTIRRKPNMLTPSSKILSEFKSSSAFSAFCDEGYGSGEDPAVRAAELEVAEALMDMRSATSSSPGDVYVRNSSAESTPTPRGHKRTISKTNDEMLQGCVSELLRSHMSKDAAMEVCASPHEITHEGKQFQRPHKSWADFKIPVPNTRDTKRMARYCAMRRPSASDLAAQYLREGTDIITHIPVPPVA
jgi:PHO85 cyclin-5